MDANAFAQIRQTASRRPQSSRNTLFLGRGDGTYAEIAHMAGMDASDWSWCPVFLDVDLDGFEDLLITTGHWRDAQHADVARELDTEAESRRLSPREQLRLRRRFPRLDTPNVAFRNRGDRTFAEVGAAWGFDSRRISQGIALADLDDDGDLDAVINCLNDAPLVLRNNTAAAKLIEYTNHLTKSGVTARAALEPLVLMTAPLAPHLAEELWRRLGHDTSLAHGPFPEADPRYLVADTVEYPVQVNGKVRGHITVAADADRTALEQQALADEKVMAFLAGAVPKKVIVVPGRLVNIVI